MLYAAIGGSGGTEISNGTNIFLTAGVSNVELSNTTGAGESLILTENKISVLNGSSLTLESGETSLALIDTDAGAS